MKKMKKSLFVIIVVFTTLLASSQQRIALRSELKNHSERATLHKYGANEIIPYNQNLPLGISNKFFDEYVIGSSQYDLQSNSSVDQRIRLYPDGTIGATYTFGTGTFADRGTGYNYYNGTSWGPVPSLRLEAQRTGWPSYAPLGNGEVIFCHNYPNNSVLLTRPVKGTGSWTETNIANPPGSNPTWPRIVSVGDTLHVLVNSYGPYQGMRQAVMYMRSTDGGQTWTDIIPAGMTSVDYLSIGGDTYAWAEPKNGTLAFVVGGKWHDVFLMKSTDGGNTWTKSLIFYHSNPTPMWQTPPVFADTTFVCDGALAVELDNSGTAHVVFGIQRVMYDPVEDPTNEGAFSYFPFTDGLAYWREGDATFFNLNPDDVYADGKLAAWIPDVDESGVVMDNLTSIDQLAKYYLSLTSMPQLTIDDNDHMYLVFVSPNETLFNGSQFYNHVWARKSIDGGLTWSDFSEITGGVVHEYSECVFPSTSKTSDDFLHILVQIDDEPGLHARGDEDPITTNEMIYFRILKSYIGVTSAEVTEQNLVHTTNIYPNPANDKVYIHTNSPFSTKGEIRIMNSFGQVMYSAGMNISLGNSAIEIQVDAFPAGLYIVSVETPGKVFNHKLMIQ
jgi:hypothetical protein